MEKAYPANGAPNKTGAAPGPGADPGDRLRRRSTSGVLDGFVHFELAAIGSVDRLMFRLRFSEREIEYWASRYSYPGEPEIEQRVAPAARKRGYPTLDEFLAICRWKTPRSAPRCATNAEAYVRDVARVALHSGNEEFKIRALTLLRGVSWPTASVILHWCDQGRYPILDYRALWSLGLPLPPQYAFPFWQGYCGYVRALASRTGHSMRVVDRALWQYSKGKQR